MTDDPEKRKGRIAKDANFLQLHKFKSFLSIAYWSVFLLGSRPGLALWESAFFITKHSLGDAPTSETRPDLP